LAKLRELSSTGCTGYIGGDALYALVKAHPEYDITCLVRDEKKGKQTSDQYPNIRLIYGDLDNSELLSKESSEADIVCRM
jgi:N-acetyl-gamma-glutamylphosphate reductase